MTLQDVIHKYISWRRVQGAKFETEAVLLYAFARHVGGAIGCDTVTSGQVCSYLVGNGSLTRYRANKYCALKGFYVYAVSRGYATSSPLPDNEPKSPPSAPPYIYSHDELARLFNVIDVTRKHAVKLDADTFRTLLLILYGAGLRGAEARALTIADVDLSAAVLNVRNSKFYKSRLVPVGPQLADDLRAYWALRADRPAPKGRESSFLAYLDGTPVQKHAVAHAFKKLRRAAGIHRKDDARQPPRLHSFRHSFAVHRLTAWYRDRADLQRLLPVLSTYLGHARLAHSQVYLSMTAELLQEASLRLECYMRGANDEE